MDKRTKEFCQTTRTAFQAKESRATRMKSLNSSLFSIKETTWPWRLKRHSSPLK